jgi:hypothetical protein
LHVWELIKIAEEAEDASSDAFGDQTYFDSR